MVLARALAAVRNEPVQDQVLAAKSAWGIVADDLSEEGATSLGQALRAQGVECAVRRTAALPRLPGVERAKTLDELPDGRAALIAATAITETITETKDRASARLERTGGLSFNMRAERMPVDMTETKHKLNFYADLYFEDLVQAAPEAWMNYSARVLLEGKPIRRIGHRSLDDLEREARWLLTLRGMAR